MIKITKDTIKLAIVLILAVLTFNIVYDVGVSNALKNQPETREVTSLDKVKAIAEAEATRTTTQRPTAPVEIESGKSKVIKYVSIVGILILAIAMLIILANKEELDD